MYDQYEFLGHASPETEQSWTGVFAGSFYALRSVV